ncbi:M48 family metallopeptidase [Sporolactobacillus putidus]|uniref:Metalloprotease n=1 Tax=Sporolactobacillus putidus TaxID=492735 RepID=A0A917S033_9BACL|nr:M48 family metallopeptidase [Sporolactobacillus putidus]GGL46212.1 metalloprotease [Sporolactobacillus putidus]
MRKAAWGFIVFYFIYIVIMAGYFFVWSKSGLPPGIKGTPADPSQFMTGRQLAESADYNAWRHFLSFASIPLEWAVYLFVLISGFSQWLRRRSEQLSSLFLVRIFVCFAVLSLISAAVFFPINFAEYQLSLHYGISVQHFSDWIKNQGITFAVDGLISFITLTAVFFFIRRNPRSWWLPVWLLSVPFIVFILYLQPVVIDPLYNHFQSLQDGELKSEILHLASSAGIPANNVFEVDMSSQTNAMNAYVNGVGSHLRIVLWDTTVQRLSRPEVLFIMAHEMGHYVMHHIIWGTVAALAGLFIGLFLAAKGLLWTVQRWGPSLNLAHPGDLAALPLVLLLFSFLSFAGEPVQNAVSRQFEHAADVYAIQMTQNRKAAISSFQKISAASLGEINPPALVKFVQYDHPTMLDRINFLEHVKLKK